MNMKYITLIFGAALLAGCQTTQQVAGTGYNTLVNKAINIGHVNSVNPDCSPRGVPVARTVVPPANGRMIIRDTVDYPKPGYQSTNSHYHCNKKKILGVNITYQPNPGYTGPDSATVEYIYPSGRYVSTRHLFTVR